MTPLVIAAADARRLTLALSGLADPPGRRLTADGLLALIEQLGFVQLDSIQTVARAHHMILFARHQRYRPELLRRLCEDEGRLFEHWTDRIAALIPTRFYPYWTRRFLRDAARLEERFTRWFGPDYRTELDRLLARIRAEGPLMARELAAPGGRPAGGWWEWHVGKAALEYLWRGGQLAVARRQGFQKVYDLPERVIPPDLRRETPTHDAFVDWACRSALDRLGFATPGELARFWGLLTPAEATGWARASLGSRPVSPATPGASSSPAPTSPTCCAPSRRRPSACARSTPSTRSCATATASPACSASTTASRSSCRRLSAGGATTSSRCSRPTV